MLKKLIKVLKEDNDFFESWKSDIAMSVYDEYCRVKDENEYLSDFDIHKMCNDGVGNFLYNLTRGN